MIVRKDLSHTQQVVQAAHAAHESGIRFGDINHFHSIVLCVVENEKQLLKEDFKLRSKGVRTIVFREPDLNNEITAIVLEDSYLSKKICKNLSLFK